jgi:ankyrin repeat protein
MIKISTSRINQRDKNGWDERDFTPLMKAVARGHFRTVKLLIEQGANVNSLTNKDGLSALMIAIFFPKINLREDICRFLIHSGATLPNYDTEFYYSGFGGVPSVLRDWNVSKNIYLATQQPIITKPKLIGHNEISKRFLFNADRRICCVLNKFRCAFSSVRRFRFSHDSN